MKAIELVKKLSCKLLGKKVNMPATVGLATVIPITPDKKKASLVLDGLHVTQRPEHWRN
jgi:hypothetical protein